MFQRDPENRQHNYVGTPDLSQYIENPDAGVYTYQRTMMGWMLNPQQTATDRYVELPSAEMNLVREEISEFFDTEVVERIRAAGFVNKRGILMYGPPGSGKSRMMTRIVEQMAVQNDAVVLSGIDPDGDLRNAVDGIRAHNAIRPIIVIWDEFETTSEKYEHQLLRWLDGVESVDNILFIACMNDINKVPSRIYSRPSRFSLVVEFGHLNREARLIYMQGAYPDGDVETMQALLPLGDNKSLDFTKELAFLAFVRRKTVAQIEDRLLLLKKMGADFNESGAVKDDGGKGGRKRGGRGPFSEDD